jgi:hypothetical protein
MNTSMLTDVQLMHLYLNRRLDKAIRHAVYDELLYRNKDFEQSISYMELAMQINKKANDSLPGKYKTGLLLLPFIFPVYLAVKAIIRCEMHDWKPQLALFLLLPGGLVAHYGVNRYLAEGRSKKWRVYWTWLCLGYLLWTLLLVIWASIFLG